MITTPYHVRLPETACSLFVLIYGLFALFALSISSFILLGLVAVFKEDSTKFLNKNNIIINLLILFLFSFIFSYGMYALSRAWRLAKNKQNLPLIKQKIAQTPIPTRSLPQNSYTWKTWYTHENILYFIEKYDNLIKDKSTWLILILAIIILLEFEYLGFWQIVVYLMCFSSLIGLLKQKLSFSLQLDYQPINDILTIKQLDNEKIWQSQDVYLNPIIGVCTIWQPETQMYLIQLINKKYEAQPILSHRAPLEKITQKIARATGLPILQENPLKAIT